MTVTIAKIYFFFGKKFYLFIISSRRKCVLLENVIEIELIHLNFNVHTDYELVYDILTSFCHLSI